MSPKQNIFQAKNFFNHTSTRGGVEDTRLEAKAKGTKKNPRSRPAQPFREQTLLRPRTGMLEAKAKDRNENILQKKS